MRGNKYQISLIVLGLLTTFLFSGFFFREIFPEYKKYQNLYVALEEFRSSYTGEPPPPFKFEVKQILLPQEGNGPARVDRCISCHLTVQYAHFSPTQIAVDINGEAIFDEQGEPVMEENPDYTLARVSLSRVLSRP